MHLFVLYDVKKLSLHCLKVIPVDLVLLEAIRALLQVLIHVLEEFIEVAFGALCLLRLLRPFKSLLKASPTALFTGLSVTRLYPDLFRWLFLRLSLLALSQFFEQLVFD